jgi:hypothetical protein
MNLKDECDPHSLQFPDPVHRVDLNRDMHVSSVQTTSLMEFEPNTIVQCIISQICVDMPDDLPA